MIIVNGTRIEKNKFPDGTLKMLDMPHSDAKSVYMTWKYEEDEEFFFYAAASHYREFANYLIIFIPYIPHARMDRTKNDNECFTLNYFANLINAVNADKIMCYDPHSNVVKEKINNLVVMDYRLVSCLEGIANREDYDYICFPDNGAYEKYAAIFKETGLFVPSIHCDKVRDWETGKITDLKLVERVDLTGKTVLIVDDIVSYGGTLIRAAKCLKAAGAERVLAYTSHAEQSVFKGQFFYSDVDKLYTTDSLLHDNTYIQLYSSLGKLEVAKW